jgi:2-methylcitrate dehydratase PrpD
VADEIQAVSLMTNEKSLSAKFHDADPPGEVDRAFSFPHAASMIVLDVPPGPRWFEPGWSADPAATRLRHLVRVELHPDAPRYPEWIVDHQIRELPASAAVVTRHGTWTAEATLGLGAPWSADTRLTDDALADKFRDLALPLGAGDDRWAAALETTIDTVLTARATYPVRALTEPLHPAATRPSRPVTRP